MSTSPLMQQSGVSRVREALAAMELDGWLLYEFHGHNPIAAKMLDLDEGKHTTRRAFVLIPREGDPVALIHAIELSAWGHWPWTKRTYSGWRQLEEEIGELVAGRPRLAMEVSERSAVPTLDLVPSGALTLVLEAGVQPVSSGDLVSLFHSVWSEEQLERHRAAARIVAEVARWAFEEAAQAIREDSPITEGELTRRIIGAFTDRGLTDQADCIVAIGPRAADAHYSPGQTGETIKRGDLLLIDLWGGHSSGDVPADQTWMGFMGSELPEEAAEIWTVVRDARDAGFRFLQERFASGSEVRGYEVDDVCRAHIREHGFGEQFVHRTGHSMDTDLHGSGPNLDNLETKDDRLLVPGLGFSIEPGIYFTDRIGVRSEINVHWGADGPIITGPDPQVEVFLLLED